MRMITTKQTSEVCHLQSNSFRFLGKFLQYLVAESDNSEKIKSFLFKMIKDKVPVLVLTSGRTRVRVADKT